MRITVHTPAGTTLPPNALRTIGEAANDGKNHPVTLHENASPEVLVQVETCDFDDFKALKDSVRLIIEAIYRMLERAYSVVGMALGHPYTKHSIPAYIGHTG
jgi:hypothetical protein